MEENNQIIENCKEFIEQYISCKNKNINESKELGTEFDLIECNLVYSLTKKCVNKHMNFITS